MKTLTYILPVYWASYLINGDASGLSACDQGKADAWLAREGNPNIVGCGESYFSRSNDAGTLAGDVCDYTALDRGLDNMVKINRNTCCNTQRWVYCGGR